MISCPDDFGPKRLSVEINKDFSLHRTPDGFQGGAAIIGTGLCLDAPRGEDFKSPEQRNQG
jgi:hypothetical protein